MSQKSSFAQTLRTGSSDTTVLAYDSNPKPDSTPHPHPDPNPNPNPDPDPDPDH